VTTVGRLAAGFALIGLSISACYPSESDVPDTAVGETASSSLPSINATTPPGSAIMTTANQVAPPSPGDSAPQQAATADTPATTDRHTRLPPTQVTIPPLPARRQSSSDQGNGAPYSGCALFGRSTTCTTSPTPSPVTSTTPEKPPSDPPADQASSNSPAEPG
jgi:hypothetical protein